MVELQKKTKRLLLAFWILLLPVVCWANDFEKFLEELQNKKTEAAQLNFVKNTEPSVQQWSTTDQGRFYHQKGLVLEINDQIETAKKSFTQSIEIFAQAGEPNGYWVKSLLDRSYMDYLLTNDPQAYCADRQEAVALARKIEKKDALVGSLVQLSFCFQDSIQDFKTGLSILEEAATLSQENQLAGTMTALIHNATGNLYRKKRISEKAYEYYQKAYDAWASEQGREDIQDMFNMQHNMVGESINLGEWALAQSHIQKLFELAENNPDFRDFTFFAFYNKAAVAFKQKQFVEAIESIEMALELSNTTSENYFIQIMKAFRVIAYFRQGEKDIAGRIAAETMDEIGETGTLKSLKKQVNLIHQYHLGQHDEALDQLWALLDDEEKNKQEFIQNAVALQSVTFDQKISKFQEQALADQLIIKQLELDKQKQQNDINQLRIWIISLAAITLFATSWFLFRSRKSYLKLSQTDFLTKVANRRHIISSGKSQLKSCQDLEEPFSLSIIDIDDFKQINDQYGHVMGDQVIKQVANTLKETLDKDQHLGRIGGEEFLVMMPSMTLTEAEQLIEQVRIKVAQMAIAMPDRTVNISISCGVTERQDTTEAIEKLMKRADDALYQAKSTGKNRTIIWQGLNE